MRISEISYRPFGERAIELVWPQEINEKILYQIRAVSNEILNLYGSEIEDLIPTYANLLVVFAHPVDFKKEVKILRDLLEHPIKNESFTISRWNIPVCYHPEFGLDIEYVCSLNSLSVENLIKLHSGRDYRIHFFGFLPGFFYLGGLDDKLHIKRKATPRRLVVKGSVGIGGTQTGIYPQDSPGGWQVIGRTPVDVFDTSGTPPVFAKLGDIIRFYPIDMGEFNRIIDPSSEFKIKEEVIK